MKLPNLFGGKDRSEAPPPALPLPTVDPRRLAEEQRAAQETAERDQRRADRQQQAGPAARLATYPADPLKTEGPKSGTQPPPQVEKVATPLTHNPTPQRGPDIQQPGGSGIRWVSRPQPVEKKPPFEELQQAITDSKSDKTAPGGDDIGGR